VTKKVFDPLPWVVAPLVLYAALLAALAGYESWSDQQTRRCGCEGCSNGWCGR
jgi:hypothetical protein